VVRQMEEQAQENYRSRIRALEEMVQQTQQRVNDLQRGRDADQRFVLSPEQQEELLKLRQEEAEVSRELKELRRNLRRDVDSLQNRIKILNIGAMPLAVMLTGIAAAVYKRRKTAAK
jgi:hypothetical protein